MSNLTACNLLCDLEREAVLHHGAEIAETMNML